MNQFVCPTVTDSRTLTHIENVATKLSCLLYSLDFLFFWSILHYHCTALYSKLTLSPYWPDSLPSPMIQLSFFYFTVLSVSYIQIYIDVLSHCTIFSFMSLPYPHNESVESLYTRLGHPWPSLIWCLSKSCSDECKIK